jgi:pimeloyl-ACP methyl ester carboxylesterase
MFFLSFTLFAFSQSKRPQTDSITTKEYLSETVALTSSDATRLSGTYTKPKGITTKAHIVLISGSGAQDRNSDLLGHKSFLLLSDRFTKAGFAVLRVDDRGAGKSGGNYNQSRLTDFLHDTEAAIDFIKKENKGNPKICLIGHSLGGIIGPKIAQERSDVHSVIALAGSTMRGDQLMLLQKELIEIKMGYPEQMVKPGIENFKKLYATLLQPHVDMEITKKDLATTAKEIFPMLPENQLNMIVGQLTSPWLYEMIRLDPKDYLTKLTKPTLFIFGEKDLQVPPKEIEALAKTYLSQAGNKHFETKIFPNLNHLFQNCASGLPTEYGTIEETFSEEVIGMMIGWINKVSK